MKTPSNLSDLFVFADGDDFMSRHGDLKRARKSLDEAFAAGVAQALAQAFEREPVASRIGLAPGHGSFQLSVWLRLDGSEEIPLREVSMALSASDHPSLFATLPQHARELSSQLGIRGIERVFVAFNKPLRLLDEFAPDLCEAMARSERMVERGSPAQIARALGLETVASMIDARAIDSASLAGSGVASKKKSL